MVSASGLPTSGSRVQLVQLRSKSRKDLHEALPALLIVLDADVGILAKEGRVLRLPQQSMLQSI